MEAMSTVDERRAQREYDRRNPWRPIADAKADGTVADLQFSGMGGEYSTAPVFYFLDAVERTWHNAETGDELLGPRGPMAWRPVDRPKLSVADRAALLRSAQRRDDEARVWNRRESDREYDRER